jgi:ribosome biogenesis GTPase
MEQGIIVKNISNQYDCLVGNEIITCIPRGKFRHSEITPLVGDHVLVNKEEKVIDEVLPRKNELSRPSVANVDIAIIITSVKKPDISLTLLDKQLVLIEKNNIIPIIVFTKLDLLNSDEKNDINNIIKYYKKIGYTVLTNNNIWRLKRILKNKIVVLTGQTGAGKSSLINKMDKELDIKTSPISEALGRGVHTTRNTEIYNIKGIHIVDTPGFSSLDLNDLKPDDIKNYFKEFSKIQCEFKDCNHEKNCEVTKSVDKGIIRKSRYDSYLRFLKECYETSSKLFK